MSGINGNGTPGNIPFDDAMCERYVFGELSEADEERFETAYFQDDAFFNRFLAVKDELLDLYARDELDANKKQRLELQFQSTPPRRRRLAEARDFISSVTMVADRTAPKTSSVNAGQIERPGMLESLRRGFFLFPASAAVGALLILLAVGLWIIRPVGVPEKAAEQPLDPGSQSVESSESAEATLPETKSDKEQGMVNQGKTEESHSESKPSQTEVVSSTEADVPPVNGKPAPGQLQIDRSPVNGSPPPGQFAQRDEPQKPQPTDPKPDVAEVIKPDGPRPDTGGDRTESVTLSSTSRSATKSNTASIGSATRTVVVRLLFGGDIYPSYAVTVSTIGGETVWRAILTTSMNEGAKSIAVPIPAGSLTRKDYIVVLKGRSKDGKLETIREYYLHVDRH